MKKFKLLIVALISVILLPMSINAASNEKITVHIFRGEGCGYCKAALSFFDSIEEEYGQYYELEEHEVWYDEDNATLMSEVASYFNEEVNGVPYIIIGDKTFQGYTESYDDEIKQAIKDAYDSGSFVDRVKQVQDGTATTSNDSKKDKDSNTTTIIIIAVALVGFVALFYFARDNSTEEVEVKEEKVKEEVKVEPKKEEKVTSKKTTTTKTTASKKTVTSKKTTPNKSTKSSTSKKATTTKTAPKKTTSAKKTTTKKSGK